MSQAAWRTEVDAELGEARAQLAAARADHAAALVEQAAAQAVVEAQRDIFAALQRPLSSALSGRLRELERGTHAADGRVAQAAELIAVLAGRVLDLEQAQRELQIIAGEIEQ